MYINKLNIKLNLILIFLNKFNKSSKLTLLLLIIFIINSCNQIPFSKEKVGLEDIKIYLYGDFKRQEELSFFYFSKDGKPFSGIIESYYPSNKLRYQLEINEGLLEGQSVYYNSNGTIRWKTGFSHGIKSGKCESYNEIGENKVASNLELKPDQISYIDKHLNEVTPLTGYYSNAFELVLENVNSFYEIGLSGEGKKPLQDSTEEATATSEI